MLPAAEIFCAQNRRVVHFNIFCCFEMQNIKIFTRRQQLAGSSYCDSYWLGTELVLSPQPLSLACHHRINITVSPWVIYTGSVKCTAVKTVTIKKSV